MKVVINDEKSELVTEKVDARGETISFFIISGKGSKRKNFR